MKKEDMKKQKNLVIFAGVNGAGKSTAYEIDPCLANNLPIINPDVYAKEMANKVGARSINDLPPNLQTKVNIKAGKLALIKREKALKEGLSFGIETTASSDSIFRLIDKAHKLDYLVNLVYVMLPNEYVHIKRVSQRVRVGGHNVNSEDIKRRFSRATILFPKLLSKTDIAHVFDNTTNYKLALEKEIPLKINNKPAITNSIMPKALNAGFDPFSLYTIIVKAAIIILNPVRIPGI